VIPIQQHVALPCRQTLQLNPYLIHTRTDVPIQQSHRRLRQGLLRARSKETDALYDLIHTAQVGERFHKSC